MTTTRIVVTGALGPSPPTVRDARSGARTRNSHDRRHILSSDDRRAVGMSRCGTRHGRCVRDGDRARVAHAMLVTVVHRMAVIGVMSDRGVLWTR